MSTHPSKPRDIQQLLAIMRRLRAPQDGCPWDQQQTFATIAPYTIEEAYEVAEAINDQDMTGLREELGDLLFQVVFHAQMAEEAGHFAFPDVVAAISDKMIRRHPHVFADANIEDAPAQSQAWENMKAKERSSKDQSSALDGVPLALPALTRAEKLQKRAARTGFDWPSVKEVFDKIEEEIGELHEELDQGGSQHRLMDEMGDLLFVVANLARHLDLDPEEALRQANRKFERRFRAVETEMGAAMKSATLDEMETVWQRVKKQQATKEQ